MTEPDLNGVHEASASALGFYFQAHFALYTLLCQSSDDAVVAVERLDDVELRADGQSLLFQLKHSMSEKPPAISLSSVALWKTIRVWIDILPNLSLSETTFHLVAVGDIPAGSPLQALCNLESERTALLEAVNLEAGRVKKEREDAAAAKTKLPHADRARGCEAYLELTDTERKNLVRRMVIHPGAPDIRRIEAMVAKELHILPSGHRAHVAKRLLEWWGLQVVYSLCGERDRLITASELKLAISSLNNAVEEEKLSADYETITHSPGYQPDSMLNRQIALVGGSQRDVIKATREQWRATQQRSRWVTENPGMKSKIVDYDMLLTETWSDRHGQIIDDCEHEAESVKRQKGLELLRWTHDQAPKYVRPIAEGWNSDYYVRGSYQVLAINRKVGWHPEFLKLLDE